MPLSISPPTTSQSHNSDDLKDFHADTGTPPSTVFSPLTLQGQSPTCGRSPLPAVDCGGVDIRVDSAPLTPPSICQSLTCGRASGLSSPPLSSFLSLEGDCDDVNGAVHMNAAGNSTVIEVANVEDVNIEAEHITTPHIGLTDEQFNILLSRLTASALTNTNPASTPSDSNTFAIPPFRFVQQAGTPSEVSLLDAFPSVPADTIREIIHFEFFPPRPL